MTEYRANPDIRDLWSQKSGKTSYDKLSLSPSFLNYFSDEIRFQYTQNLTENEAIDESLRRLMLFSPYTIEGEEEVSEYIHANKGIYLAVMDSLAAAAETFPEGKRVLSLHQDSEADDKYLVISIGFEKYPVNLFELMDSLEPRYLQSLKKAVSGWLSVVPKHISA